MLHPRLCFSSRLPVIPAKTALWGLLLCVLMVPAWAADYALDDYPLPLIEQGQGKPRVGRCMDGRPMRMGGTTYTHGIGTHAVGEIRLRLDGQAEAFTAMVGLSEFQRATTAKVEFRVEGDGKVLWSSGPMTGADAPKPVDVPLAGIRLLKLWVGDGGKGNSENQANWADARIRYAQAVPEPDATLIKVASRDTILTYVVRKDQTLGILEVASRDHTWVSPLFGSLFPGKPARYGNGPRYQGPIAIVQADGDTCLEPIYVSHDIKQEAPGIEHLTITLRDRVYPVTIELHLRVYAEQNVFEQWQTIINGQSRPMGVPRLDSLYWQASAESDIQLEWFDSHEGFESGRLYREKLVLGNRVLESVDGCRHKSGPMPQFVLGFGTQPDETTGACMLSALAWSGNTRLSFSLNSSKILETSVGVNEPGTPILVPGQSRSSPVCVSTFSPAGKGPASRNLHRWMRTYGLRDGNRIRPVDNNSWEGCGMNVSEAAVLEMMRLSADLGIELYVLDDGWFGDSRNLGDWWVNPKLFPNGLQKCIQEGKRLGIDFGIWFEPEMLNDGAKLAKQHPEWVMRVPGRELARQRNQVTLDVANPAVQEFMFKAVDDTLKANPGIRMVKWDCNSNINNPYSPFLGSERQGDMLDAYFAGYYGVMQRLVTAHPQVDFQACAAGGGRADLGALRFAHTFWPSDNTDPGYRLGAVWNFSTHLPALAATCHVTHAGNCQPKYRFDVGMMGQLGLEIDPRKTEPDYQAAAKVGIAAYKSVRDVIQFGDQYRHRNPADSTTPSLNYVSADRARAVVLAYQTGDVKSALSVNAPVAGLDPARVYRISELNLPPGDEKPRLALGTPAEQTGAAWMAQGVPLSFTRRNDSAVLLLK